MGTPASVVSEPPLWQVSTEARGRKQASANIFQDAELVQIQGLFQRSGDQLAEERAQIIWECAGDHRVAEALRRLRRKRPPRQNHCSSLR
ncbi:Arginine vasopressin-induced protein 1 [Lemmus lemmus]